MRPKILLTNFHPGHGGGHFTYLKTLCASSLSDDFDFAVASPPGSDIIRFCKDAGVRHFELEFPGNLRELPGVVRSVTGLHEIYRRFPFDILHANGSRDHWIAVYWKIICRRSPPLIRTRHAIKKTRADWIHKKVNNNITSMNIFVSNQAKVMSESEKGALKFDNGVVIPHGIDLDRYSPMPRDEVLASQYGIGGQDFVFGSVAGLGSYKRVDQFLRAFSRVQSERNIKIAVLGQEESARNLQRLAAELGMGDKFVYGGYHRDVRRFVSLFHVGFVMSDSIETLSYAAREMMAMGVPLISSNYSGLVENVDHNVNGVLVDPRDLESIQDGISKFLRMPRGELEQYSREARRKAERAFSLDEQMRQMRGLYERVLRV